MAFLAIFLVIRVEVVGVPFVVISVRLLQHLFQVMYFGIYLDWMKTASKAHEHAYLGPELADASLALLGIHVFPGLVDAILLPWNHLLNILVLKALTSNLKLLSLAWLLFFTIGALVVINHELLYHIARFSFCYHRQSTDVSFFLKIFVRRRLILHPH